MACLKKGCTLEGYDDRMIICWLCHGLCHFKCSGLSGLVAESISKHKNLHWRCNGCQKIGADFYRFFQSTKNNFLQIQNNLINLSGQISSYGKLFEDFKSLEGLQSPQLPSPTRRKSPRFLNNENSNQELNLNLNNSATTSSFALPNLNQNAKSNSVEILINKTNTNTVFSSPLTTNDNGQNAVDTSASNIAPSLSVTTPQSCSNASVMSTTTIPQPFANAQNFTDPINSGRLINLDASSPMPYSSSLGTTIADPETSTVPRALRTIPPKKTIFATRFAQDTTAAEMKSFVMSKIQNVNLEEILVYKMNSRYRASFKIIVPEDLFQQIVNPDFWPKNALVREFIYKEEDNVRLPRSVDPTPKN